MFHPLSIALHDVVPVVTTRLGKFWWVARLAVGKMREGPGPWFRALGRGLFGLLPVSWQVGLVRWRYQVPAPGPRRLSLAVHAPEREGRISVILPVYNQCDLLAESIKSVLFQTYADVELILINDGSSDDVEPVLEMFAADPRVRILTQPNLKLPAALSNAFRFADGDYRTWTSADNVMEPTQLAEQVRFLEENPTTALVYADYRVIGLDGEPLLGSGFRPHNRSSHASSEVRLPRDPIGLEVLQDNFVGACFLYRGWVGRLVGDYSSELGIEDHDYWMRIFAGFGIEHIGSDALLYRYRWHDNSLSSRAGEIRLFETGRQLMRHERQRARWRAERWYVILHESQAWIGDLECRDVTLGPAGSHGGKSLWMTVPDAMDPGCPDVEVVGVEWADLADVYRFSDRLRDPRMVHFTADDEVLAALCLFTNTAFLIERSRERVDLALCFGNELVCDGRAGRCKAPALPQVWTGRGSRRRVVAQVASGASQVVFDQVVYQLHGLAAQGLKVQLVVLGEGGCVVERAASAGIAVASVLEHEPLPYREYLDAADLVLSYQTVWGWQEAASRAVPFVPVLSQCVARADAGEWAAADKVTTAHLFASAEVAGSADLGLGLSPAKGVVLTSGSVATPVQGTDGEEETWALASLLMWLLDGGSPAQGRAFFRGSRPAPTA
ncbi:MAG: glycosyltransferase family 2 protein [Planctomycetota bacterium]|nr:glycosyltransferase family 2 protein [Planctomycetota bacterium]